MQNKIIIFFLIIFNLIIFKGHSNDQITFDVSELEILDDGNKIIGKNRGIIITQGCISFKVSWLGRNISNAPRGNILVKSTRPAKHN